jgi:hypothetical protein
MLVSVFEMLARTPTVKPDKKKQKYVYISIETKKKKKKKKKKKNIYFSDQVDVVSIIRTGSKDVASEKP